MLTDGRPALDLRGAKAACSKKKHGPHVISRQRSWGDGPFLIVLLVSTVLSRLSHLFDKLVVPWLSFLAAGARISYGSRFSAENVVPDGGPLGVLL